VCLCELSTRMACLVHGAKPVLKKKSVEAQNLHSVEFKFWSEICRFISRFRRFQQKPVENCKIGGMNL
jgi:hypothetical protein